MIYFTYSSYFNVYSTYVRRVKYVITRFNECCAAAEEEIARTLQGEIDKNQSEISNMQKSMREKSDVVTSLQEKQRRAGDQAGRLRQQGMEKQQSEQEELIAQQQQDRNGLLKAASNITIQRGFWG